MNRTRLLSFLGAAILLLAGCSSGSKPATSLKLETDGMSFKQSKLELAVGQPVSLEFVNGDGALHDFAIEKIEVKVANKAADAHAHGSGAEPDLHVSAAAGKTGKLEFTPLKAGTYTYYCTVAGHRDAGMEGKLVVQ